MYINSNCIDAIKKMPIIKDKNKDCDFNQILMNIINIIILNIKEEKS